MRVLIIDDSIAMRQVEKKMLLDIGISDISEACDGEQGLKMISSQRFDLILLDLKMPVMSGLETLKRLKADPAYQSIPVVVITSESHLAKIREAIQAGATGYINKTFNEEGLKKTINWYLKNV